jgi:non-specific serine/threonine protein kinase
MSIPAISNLERGVNRPRLETVTLLAEALDLSTEQRTGLLTAALREREGAVPSSPSGAAAVTPRHNLPVPPNALVGREREVAAVRARVQEPAVRLLTLTGVGGVGKTRLALAVVADVVEQYPDGVWLADLAPLADPALVPGVVAGVLELREERNRPLATTLAQHLRDRQLLLVLDNCEHLLGACAELASALLSTCPRVRILATSREGLGVSGEHVHRVLPLNVPDPHRPPPPELMGSYEAVRLFVARARARRQQFALAEHNAAAVATICERLDGIPLALELAAARVSSLPVEAIAARLDERFRLLIGGPRDALPRQQTLRATMDWSWELLGKQERTLLGRLSVFAGGWTLAAAEAVCSGDGVERLAMLDLLDGLANRSLIWLDETGAEARYRLLETVRQYAGERLAEAGELGAMRARHLDWCVALAEEAESELTGGEQGTWLVRLEHEHDNLRAALVWSLSEAGDPALGLRLATALGWFWYLRGYLSEGSAWLEQALARAASAPSALRAAALNAAGNLASDQGDYGHAEALYTSALGLRRALGDKRGVAASLSNLAGVAERRGDHGRAVPLFEEALALAREVGDTLSVAKTLGNLGLAVAQRGDLAREATLFEEALRLFRALGDTHSIAGALDNLGQVAFQQGAYVRARGLHEEALGLFRTLGAQRGIAGTLSNLAAVAEREGAYDRAAALSAESLRLNRTIGAEEQAVEGLQTMALVAAAHGRSRRAARLAGAAAALRVALAVPMRPYEQPIHAEAARDLRAALGEETFAGVWADGQALSFEEAIALALSHDARREPSHPI